jgi:hypothetical protein
VVATNLARPALASTDQWASLSTNAVEAQPETRPAGISIGVRQALLASQIRLMCQILGMIQTAET